MKRKKIFRISGTANANNESSRTADANNESSKNSRCQKIEHPEHQLPTMRAESTADANNESSQNSRCQQ
jgi:hypothetical protein